jgi:hypothetical protein
MDVLQLAQCCDAMKMPYKTMARSERSEAMTISISPWACTATAQIPTTAVLATRLEERRYVLMLFFVGSMLTRHAPTKPHDGGGTLDEPTRKQPLATGCFWLAHV